MIADWMTSLGLGSTKPVLAALVLPPVPLLALALAGAWLARTRPRAGRLMALVACAGLWLGATNGAARWVERTFLAEPAALGPAERAALKARAAAGTPMAIVVLGGGVDRSAPEYGTPTLNLTASSRLRYGVWLSRGTGIPLAASGGLGWGASAPASPAEAALMATTARTEFGTPIRWLDTTSRDTHENAANTLALLQASGVREIIVVTNGWHMPRALREFRAAAARTVPAPVITAAPMGQAYPGETPMLAWMPSGSGAQRMRAVAQEVLGALIDPR